MSQFDDLKQEILYRLWRKGYEPNGVDVFSIDDLNKFLPSNLVTPMSRRAVISLDDDDFLEQPEFDAFRISLKGITLIEAGLGVPGSDLSEIEQRVGKISDVSIASSISYSIPASDRFVELNHNSDPYRAAIGALDLAVTAFKQDHRFENEWGAEKEILLKALEAGQQLLKETAVRARTVIATVLEPLKIISDRYHEAIAAGLVTAAVDHVLPSVERAVSAILALIGVV